MNLPFSHEQFLDVFGAYNTRLWVVGGLMWVASAAMAWAWFQGRATRRALFVLLAVQWAWSGIAYHWLFFRAINPAATVFAALFVAEALLLGWAAALRSARTGVPPSPVRRLVAAAFVMYALAYPFLGFALGLRYPRMPVFAVPCPTTLLTTGFLVAEGAPRSVMVLPMAWAVIGGSASLLLGIPADVGLVAAAVVLATDMVAPRLLGSAA